MDPHSSPDEIYLISAMTASSFDSPVQPASADSHASTNNSATGSSQPSMSPSTFYAKKNPESKSCSIFGSNQNQSLHSNPPGPPHFNSMSNPQLPPTHHPCPVPLPSLESSSMTFQPQSPPSTTTTTPIPFTSPNLTAIDYSSRSCAASPCQPKLEPPDHGFPQQQPLANDNLMARMTKKLCNSQSLHNVCQKRNFAKHCGFSTNNNSNNSNDDNSNENKWDKFRQSTSCTFLNKLRMSKNQSFCSSLGDKSHDIVLPPSPVVPVLSDSTADSAGSTGPSISNCPATNIFRYFKQVYHQNSSSYCSPKNTVNTTKPEIIEPDLAGPKIEQVINQPPSTESGKSVLLDLLTSKSKTTNDDGPLIGKPLSQCPGYSAPRNLDKYKNSLPKSVSAYIENVIVNSVHESPPVKSSNFTCMIESIITNYFNLSRTASFSCPTLSQLPAQNSAITNLLMDPNASTSTSEPLHQHQSISHDTSSCDISHKVYQKLINFEFNHEKIIEKFKTSCSTPEKTECLALNSIEKARIDELSTVLYPLQFCLSAMSKKNAILKKNFHQCFFDESSHVNVEFQQKVLLKMTESAINLLISLAKRIEAFSKLKSVDQTNLLRSNVMKIMMLRAIMIVPNRKIESNINLKRCLESDMSDYSETEMKTPPPSPASTQLGLESDDEPVDTVAHEYGRQFRCNLRRMYDSLDELWIEDKNIFYLIVAIYLFCYKNCNPAITEMEKVRDEHLTYIYLLKRYLENKFESNCKAKCHFIRLFDRIEELQMFNDNIVQKLLNYDVCYAQNLLQKLYIC